MAFSKKELFGEELAAKADLFKALGHPARLSILLYLAETKSCMTGDICEELPLSRTTVNQHLRELKEAGFIQGIIDGSRVNYCLNSSKIDEFRNAATGFFNTITPGSEISCS